MEKFFFFLIVKIILDKEDLKAQKKMIKSFNDN